MTCNTSASNDCSNTCQQCLFFIFFNFVKKNLKLFFVNFVFFIQADQQYLSICTMKLSLVGLNMILIITKSVGR